MVNLAYRLLTILGSALVLMFFSEYFFLNEGPVRDVLKIMSGEDSSSLFAYVEFSLWYALFAVWLLLPIVCFNVRSFWALYLTGGFFGIAAEGLVIPLIYTESLTWPALSWHVLADVVLGWFLVRYVLVKNKASYTALLAMAMGLSWAFWAQWTHVGDDPFILAPSQFTRFAVFTSTGLLIGYIVLNLVRDEGFRPTRTEVVFFVVITLALWAPMLVAAWLPMLTVKPINSLLLPLFLGVSVYTLYRHRKVEARDNILAVFQPKIVWWNIAILMLMPATAIVAYPFFYSNQIYPPTAIIVEVLNASAYVLTVLAVVQLWRGTGRRSKDIECDPLDR